MHSDFKYVVTNEDFKNEFAIKNILRIHFKFSSRLISKIKRNKSVYLNGESVAGWIIPEPGDVITVKIPEEKSNFEPKDIPIDVIYEDNDMLIINKQPGIIVHPTASHQDDTLANGIANYCLVTNQNFKLRFVNRLDRDTSGLVVVGKNSHCQDTIAKQMKSDQVKKEYIALVHGIISENKGTVDLPIARPDDIGIKRKVMAGGSPCVTHYEVCERFLPSDDNPFNPIDRISLDERLSREFELKRKSFILEHPEKQGLYEYLAKNDEKNPIVHKPGFTLLKLQLETGRTHQIRVHLSHIGYPIVGDTLYGTASDIINRQALHAQRLSFYHPVSGKPLELQAPAPDDFKSAICLLSHR